MTKLLIILSAIVTTAALMLPLSGMALAQAQTVPTCSTRTTVVWLDQLAGGGAAGSVYYGLELTNYSASTCHEVGFAGVSAVSLKGHQIGSPAVWEGSGTGFNLAPGQTATALLQVTNAENYPPNLCNQANAAGFSVIPPNQFQAKVVPFPFQACRDKGVSILHEQAFKLGLQD